MDQGGRGDLCPEEKSGLEWHGGPWEKEITVKFGNRIIQWEWCFKEINLEALKKMGCGDTDERQEDYGEGRW